MKMDVKSLINPYSLISVRKVCFLSTFPPRKCGIAVFTQDLIDSLDRSGNFLSEVVAVNKKDFEMHYGRRVPWQIRRDVEEDYVYAAKMLNRSDFDLVNVQHEFGIFGGGWGSYLLSFLETLNKPVVITLHTVQPGFAPEAQSVLSEIVRLSDAVVVMGQTAVKLLVSYGVRRKKIFVIPHGCPIVPFISTGNAKVKLGLDGRKVLCTFGLISKGKGIEYAIRALPSIFERHPEVVYLIVGQTHPEIQLTEDESYRKSLIELTEKLGMEDHVVFENRFLPKDELLTYLQATDVYLTPYVGRGQISSGTLVYALGVGRVVVSTPYLQACEVLNSGRGLFCDFRNASSIALAVNRVLDDASLKAKIERKAYAYGRDFTWSKVASKYSTLFGKVIMNIKDSPAVLGAAKTVEV
jgi:glycosyltransferase involved in cell wall biosynthesis